MNMELDFIKDWTVVKPEEEKKKAKSELEKLQNLLLEGIDKQLSILEKEQNGETVKNVKRWYQFDKDKGVYRVYLKYQNKPIPYLNDDAYAVEAESLARVAVYYNLLRAELAKKEFMEYILKCSKKVPLARGAKKD